MIKLKKLICSGFKSFAEKTEFLFHKNIVALVGPNGCGKSNIVDAIYWILQHSSIKVLRAHEKQDLIFKGNDSKRQAGFAEAEIVFEENDQQYQVKKRVYQSGEIQYYLNKQECKLKDISEFFLRYNIISPEYSIIAQGSVDRLISMKPEEKRELLEEAAGIKQYKNERIKAVNDLAKSKENIRQVEILYQEVVSELNRLKEQAQKARFYKSSQMQLINAEKSLHIIKYIKTQESIKKIEKDYNNFRESMQKVEDDFAIVESEKKEQLENIGASEKEIQIIRENNIKAESEIVQLEQSILLYHRRYEELEETKRKMLRECEFYEEKLKELNHLLQESSKDNEKDLYELYYRKEEYDKKLEDVYKLTANHEKEKKLLVESSNSIESTLKELYNRQKDQLNEQISSLFTLLEQLKKIVAAAKDNSNSLVEKLNKTEIKMNGLLGRLNDICSIKAISIEKVQKDVSLFSRDYNEIVNLIRETKEFASTVIQGYNKINDLFFSDNSSFSKREEIVRQIEKCEQNADSAKEKLSALLMEFENSQQLQKSLTDKKMSLEKDILRLEEQCKHLKKNKDRYEKEKIETEFNHDTKACEIKDIQNKMDKAKEDAYALMEKKDALFKEKKESDGKIRDIERSIDKYNQVLISLQQKHEDFYNRKRELIGTKEMYAVERGKLENQCDTIRNIYFDAYKEILDEEKLRVEINESESELRKIIVESRKNIDETGEVNFLAIDEYAECEKRHQFIFQQKEDIEKAIEKLNTFIQDLDAKLSKRFLEVFEQINKNFNSIFTSVFGGGNARLLLTDEKNILESGVEIFIQPPGKRITNIQLLSGGEKAMTAISMLFALFLYNPSPFCIMDEVDAPLDESNIMRFQKLIADFSEHTQFILISHNKLTLESAEILYGITMEREGISKVVSVKLEELEVG